ncbi:FeoB-associated Cys-rich membrane protein [Algoriphagus resistens]
MWQEIIVGIIVLAALGYLVKKYFFKSKTEAGCDKCAKP